MTAVTSSTARISFVDLSGESTVRYTPLGAMYLRASVEAAPDLTGRVDIVVHSFLQGTSIARMIDQITAGRPDLIGLSCQGWNIAVYRQLLPTLRQLLPETFIVLGGNHVSHQGARWLAQLPEVDVVANGDGEQTILDLSRHLLDAVPTLSAIPGITYRDEGKPITTPARPRAASFDEVPSPYLADSPELAGADVALWETNRGCPYHCSFCYWGGAVGQKLSRAELDRLSAELHTIAKAGVPAIFLCDANFGILPRDVQIAEMIADARQRFGTQPTLHVNWAKNHAHRVGEILDVLHQADVHTNVYLALQTLSRAALALAGRDERGRPEMMELAAGILERGGEVGAELIFGLPGETIGDFRAAYDELFLEFPSLLVHPLWILPNTTYDADRARFGLITVRPDPTVDYEGVLRHDTLSRADNQAGLRLLLADEILVGTGFARTTVRGLCRWAGFAPTQILDAFTEFVTSRDDGLCAPLGAAFAELDAECYFHRRLRGQVRTELFADRDRAHRLLDVFVRSLVAEPDLLDACRELARYDAALLPRADLTGDGHGEETLTLAYDAHATGQALLSQLESHALPTPSPVCVRVGHPAGFARHRADAIDLSAQWRGRVIAVSPAS